jgi:hypothetical protein
MSFRLVVIVKARDSGLIKKDRCWSDPFLHYWYGPSTTDVVEGFLESAFTYTGYGMPVPLANAVIVAFFSLVFHPMVGKRLWRSPHPESYSHHE